MLTDKVYNYVITRYGVMVDTDRRTQDITRGLANYVSCLSSLLVIPSGFEPETHSLEGCCSIQLSYGTNLVIIKSAAKVYIFLDITKFPTNNYFLLSLYQKKYCR